MKFKFFALILSLSFSLPSFSIAAEINGVKLPDEAKLNGKTLPLNGLGMRQVSFLKINVYGGGLYLEKPSHDGEEIAKSNTLKRVEMVFTREVEAKKIAGAWEEGFEKNCETGCEAQKPQLAKLKSLMSDVKKGDMMAYNFYPDRTEVIIRGTQVGTIEGHEFAQNMMLCWIGKNPPNEALKKGLLGLKD
jgi:hypothetical protein